MEFPCLKSIPGGPVQQHPLLGGSATPAGGTGKRSAAKEDEKRIEGGEDGGTCRYKVEGNIGRKGMKGVV